MKFAQSAHIVIQMFEHVERAKEFGGSDRQGHNFAVRASYSAAL
jgi:hypothetical protein